MDIDEFKRINDTYGHHVGDAALREVAGALQTALRPYDLCVRYAGDEFIVVLVGLLARERPRPSGGSCRSASARSRSRCGPAAHPRSAASAGAAVFPHDGTTYEALLADADQRMYRDKAARRGDMLAARPSTPAEFSCRSCYEPAPTADDPPLPEAS